MITKASKFLIKRIFASVSISYHKTKRYISETEYKSKDQLKEIQFNQIKQVLYNAYKNVPYYQRSFRKNNFYPSNFRKIEDIENLPFIDKNIYRENSDDMVSKRFRKAFLPTVFTGGTTGAPLQLYRSFSDYGRERAYTEYAYKTVGMDHRVKTVYMRGKVADEKECYHKISDFGRTLYLSSHNMKDTQLEEYVKLIREFKPVLFYTLPSVGALFAEYLHRKNISHFETLKWIFCPSENLYDFQIQVMEETLKCKIGMFYGHAEHAIFAIKCDRSNMYHMLPQYGYCELIDKTGQPIKEEGRMGEIVGTSFTNQVSPLIRYKTGDYAVYKKQKCKCGRNYMLLENLQGREQSIAVDKNHTKINVGPELLCTIHDKSYKKIKQFRIEQHKVGELCILLETYNKSEFLNTGRLFKTFFEKMYPGLFDIKILKLYETKLQESTDKHLYFVQHLN